MPRSVLGGRRAANQGKGDVMDGERFDRLARLLGAVGARSTRGTRSTRRAALGGALGLGVLAAEARPGQERRKDRGGEEGAGGARRRRRCKPACSDLQECRKRTCVCRDGGEACGPLCCAAGERCRDGACVRPEPACAAFGERCKATGQPCCPGLACGSGQGGEDDVACYRPAGAPCGATRECVYGATCRNGECVADPVAGPTPTVEPLTCDVWAAGGAAALQAAIAGAATGTVILIEPGTYDGDFAIADATLTLKRCGNAGEVLLRNVTPMPPCEFLEGCTTPGRTLTVSGAASEVTLDSVVVTCGTCEAAEGGGIYVEAGRLILAGSAEVRGNRRTRSEFGGLQGTGIYLGPQANLRMGGTSRVAENVGNVGVGIAKPDAGPGEIVIEDQARIERNRAVRPVQNIEGGWKAPGIHTAGGGTVTIRGSAAITGNEAERHPEYGITGGGMFVWDNLTLADSATVTGNLGAARGGGIYLTGGTLSVSGNVRVADNEGGGIYTYNTGAIDLRGSAEISGNTSSGRSGPGLSCNSCSQVTIGGQVRITGNQIVAGDGGDGGGVLLYYVDAATIGDQVQITGNSVISGRHRGFGGGVYIARCGTVTIGGEARIAGNSARSGGGLFVRKTNVVIEGDAEIDGNTAANGGGIQYRVRNPGPNDRFQGRLTLRGNAAVSNNVATRASSTRGGGGGGLSIRGGTCEIAGAATVTGNQAKTTQAGDNAHGGGIRLVQGTLDLSNAAANAVRGNSADSATTGAYVGNGVGGLAAGTKDRPTGWSVIPPSGGILSVIAATNAPHRCGGRGLNSDCTTEP